MSVQVLPLSKVPVTLLHLFISYRYQSDSYDHIFHAAAMLLFVVLKTLNRSFIMLTHETNAVYM
jgi:hypothetical protein